MCNEITVVDDLILWWKGIPFRITKWISLNPNIKIHTEEKYRFTLQETETGFILKKVEIPHKKRKPVCTETEIMSG